MIETEKLSRRYAVRRLDDRDAEAILSFCRENTLYYRYCGAEATREQVISDLHLTPPGIDASDKYYLGFFKGDEMAAVLDLIDGYPEPDTAFIGFFMMNAALQGKQIGSAFFRDVCAYLKEIDKTSVRLAYAKDNPQAAHFWRKNGFSVVSEVDMGGWTALVAEKTLV